MVHCSKILFNLWLLVALVVSIPFTIVALKFYAVRGFVPTQTCFVKIAWVPLLYGLCLFIMSIVGIFGSICRFSLLQSIFNVFSDILIIYSLVILLFSLFVMPTYPPGMAWESVYENTVPMNVVYPPWMQDLFVNEHKWWNAQFCLNKIQLCETAHNLTDETHHPHIERVYAVLIEGCCYPPSRCGLVAKNSSDYQWEAPKVMNASSANDPECQKWTKISDGKCYDCEMCKASYLAKFHADWKGVTYFHFIFMLFMIIASIFTSCGAFTEQRYG